MHIFIFHTISFCGDEMAWRLQTARFDQASRVDAFGRAIWHSRHHHLDRLALNPKPSTRAYNAACNRHWVAIEDQGLSILHREFWEIRGPFLAVGMQRIVVFGQMSKGFRHLWKYICTLQGPLELH